MSVLKLIGSVFANPAPQGSGKYAVFPYAYIDDEPFLVRKAITTFPSQEKAMERARKMLESGHYAYVDVVDASRRD